MLNVPTAEQAPGVTTSILEQMGMYSHGHKGYNSPFYQTKCKINKTKLRLLGIYLIQLPPLLLLFPPVSILLGTMNSSSMN